MADEDTSAISASPDLPGPDPRGPRADGLPPSSRPCGGCRSRRPTTRSTPSRTACASTCTGRREQRLRGLERRRGLRRRGPRLRARDEHDQPLHRDGADREGRARSSSRRRPTSSPPSALMLVLALLFYSGPLWWALVIPAILAARSASWWTSRFWLWWFGHNLHDWAAFTVKPFMPTVLGEGKVAQFSTYAYPHYGLALIASSRSCLPRSSRSCCGASSCARGTSAARRLAGSWGLGAPDLARRTKCGSRSAVAPWLRVRPVAPAARRPLRPIRRRAAPPAGPLRRSRSSIRRRSTIDGGGEVTNRRRRRGHRGPPAHRRRHELRGLRLNGLGRATTTRSTPASRCAATATDHRGQRHRGLSVRRRPPAVERTTSSRGNRISSKPVDMGVRGDGIRLWYSRGNRDPRQRDLGRARHGGLVLRRQPHRRQQRDAAAATRSTSCTPRRTGRGEPLRRTTWSASSSCTATACPARTTSSPAPWAPPAWGWASRRAATSLLEDNDDHLLREGALSRHLALRARYDQPLPGQPDRLQRNRRRLPQRLAGQRVPGQRPSTGTSPRSPRRGGGSAGATSGTGTAGTTTAASTATETAVGDTPYDLFSYCRPLLADAPVRPPSSAAPRSSR